MKRIIFTGIVILLVVVIFNLGKSIFSLWQKKDVLITTQHKLDQLQKDNKRLKQQYAQVQSPQFVEEQARDKLFLVKPGEQTIVISSSMFGSSEVSKPSSSSQQPNWQQWWDLFF